MYEESKKEHWFKIIGIILATFIGAFLAFYAAVDITLHRFMEPTYNFRRMEKMMQNAIDGKFMKPQCSTLYKIFTDVDEMLDYLENYNEDFVDVTLMKNI